jgi:WD40 repeat protein
VSSGSPPTRRSASLTGTAEIVSAPAALTIGSSHRPVSCVSWHVADTTKQSRVAVAYGQLTAGAWMQPGVERGGLATVDDGWWESASAAFANGRTHVSCIFDVTRPGGPEHLLRSLAPVTALAYNPRESHSLAAGTNVGGIIIFDTRRCPDPVLATTPAALKLRSDLVQGSNALFHASTGARVLNNPATAAIDSGVFEGSSRSQVLPPVPSTLNRATPPSGVQSIQWLHATGRAYELAAIDGSQRVLIWDVRAMREPVDCLSTVIKPALQRAGSGVMAAAMHVNSGTQPLPATGHSKYSDDDDRFALFAHGATALDFLPSSGGHGRLLVGTSTGSVMTLSTRGRSDVDRVSMVHGTHAGAVTCVRRHPLLGGLFASAGGRSVRVWKDTCAGPLAELALPRLAARCVSCAWHPTLASVLLVLYADGTLQAWAVGFSPDSRQIGGVAPDEHTLLASTFVLRRQPVAATNRSLSSAVGTDFQQEVAATYLALSADGAAAAVGTSTGSVVIVNLGQFQDAVTAQVQRQRQADAITEESATTAVIAAVGVTDDRKHLSDWTVRRAAQMDLAAKLHSHFGDGHHHSSARAAPGENGDSLREGPCDALRSRDLRSDRSTTRQTLAAAARFHRPASSGPKLSADDVTFDDLADEDDGDHGNLLTELSVVDGAKKRTDPVGLDAPAMVAMRLREAVQVYAEAAHECEQLADGVNDAFLDDDDAALLLREATNALKRIEGV